MSQITTPYTFFWFRRDLRLHDNCGLYQALKNHTSVLSVFIFDTNILEKLPDSDARVTFLHREIIDLKKTLQNLGSDILVMHGDPIQVWQGLTKKYQCYEIYTNNDYEPYARERDKTVDQMLRKNGGRLIGYKDQVIFEKNEISKEDGTPYTVFTPYRRKWETRLYATEIPNYDSKPYFSHLLPVRKPFSVLSLKDLGFIPSQITIPQKSPLLETVKNYHQTRDIPALKHGTSRIGVHLRFGTVSIRDWVKRAREFSEIFLSELCWRDFYQQILWHFPHVVNSAFKPQYDKIVWRNDRAEFDKWCQGQTGYPLVDAGMRQLNQIGYMHNRVRMVTASFLCKHLLIDWRWGEAYFAKKLLDFDLAANNGGWQWSASTGCDAAPYFRVFNPVNQQLKFDPDFEYIRQWVSEYGTLNYPLPMVDHKVARLRAIAIYKRYLK